MNTLVKDLKKLMSKKGLSPERASHFIGCSTNTVIRWVKNLNPPSRRYRRMIEEGIVKIKEAYPEKKVTYNMAVKARDLYQQVKYSMTLEEKAELFDIHQEKGHEGYVKSLKALCKKYRVK